jgi:hypothetical protein
MAETILVAGVTDTVGSYCKADITERGGEEQSKQQYV